MKRILYVTIGALASLILVGGVAIAYIGVRNDDLTLPVCVNTTNNSVKPLVPNTSCPSGSEQVNLATAENLDALHINPVLEQKQVQVPPVTPTGEQWEQIVLDCRDYNTSYTRVSGGGYIVGPVGDIQVKASSPYPLGNGAIGWKLEVRNNTSENASVIAYALCH